MRSSMKFAAFLALIWSALAVAEYILVLLSVPSFMAFIDASILSYISEMPLWVNVAWAIGAWAGLAGAIYWMLEMRAAVMWLALSMFGYLALGAHYVYTLGSDIFAMSSILYVVMFIAALLVSFVFYVLARETKKAGDLA